jgi:predicted MFS family arabinose efflux permease
MDSSPPLSASRERWLLLTLAAINFTHILDFMIMMPLGPQFTALFGISDAKFGLLVSAYTLAAGASGLLATTYVDRFERKALLLWLYVAFGLATLACGFAPSYGALMAARIAAGVFGGVMSALVQTIVGDVTPFERRGRAMGIVMASFSLSTVAGVPASLWLANSFGWHVPFISIALMCAVIGAVALRVMPRLTMHLRGGARQAPFAALAAVVREPNHWRALGLTALVMSAGFSIIPFITIYATVNLGIAAADVPLLYLFGGVATLFTARVFGVLTDRWGKVPTFRLLALAAVLPMLALTHLPASPLWLVIVVSTLFFIFVSGRMIPSMAIVTAATTAPLRGTFMSLNGAAQSAAMGVAAFVGGLLIHRDAAGRVEGYGWAGWLSALLSLLAVAWVSRVRLNITPATA